MGRLAKFVSFKNLQGANQLLQHISREHYRSKKKFKIKITMEARNEPDFIK